MNFITGRSTQAPYDWEASRDQLNTFSDEEILVGLQSLEPDLDLYKVSMDWRTTHIRTLKAKGVFGDVLVKVIADV